MQFAPHQFRPHANLSVGNTLATPATIYDPNWYPDSGATHHMTPDVSHLTERMDYHGGEQVLVGNGKGLHIEHIGSSVFQPFSSSYSFKLQNLLHVPHITKNLLSVSQFARDNGVYFEFFPDSCFVKSQASKEILLQGTIKNGLYFFGPIQQINSSPASFFTSTKRDQNFNLWHLRLGHPSTEVVTQVLKKCNIPFTVSDSLCTACCMGKSHNLPFSSSNSVYTLLLN